MSPTHPLRSPSFERQFSPIPPPACRFRQALPPRLRSTPRLPQRSRKYPPPTARQWRQSSSFPPKLRMPPHSPPTPRQSRRNLRRESARSPQPRCRARTPRSGLCRLSNCGLRSGRFPRTPQIPLCLFCLFPFYSFTIGIAPPIESTLPPTDIAYGNSALRPQRKTYSNSTCTPISFATRTLSSTAFSKPKRTPSILR